MFSSSVKFHKLSGVSIASLVISSTRLVGVEENARGGNTCSILFALRAVDGIRRDLSSMVTILVLVVSCAIDGSCVTKRPFEFRETASSVKEADLTGLQSGSYSTWDKHR